MLPTTYAFELTHVPHEPRYVHELLHEPIDRVEVRVHIFIPAQLVRDWLVELQERRECCHYDLRTEPRIYMIEMLMNRSGSLVTPVKRNFSKLHLSGNVYSRSSFVGRPTVAVPP